MVACRRSDYGSKFDLAHTAALRPKTDIERGGALSHRSYQVFAPRTAGGLGISDEFRDVEEDFRERIRDVGHFHFERERMQMRAKIFSYFSGICRDGRRVGIGISDQWKKNITVHEIAPD